MIDFKNTAKKGAKILLYTLLTLVLAFILYTTINAFTINENATIDNYIGNQFVTSDLTTTLQFNDNKTISIVDNNQLVTYKIIDNEKDIVLVERNSDKKTFAIKLIDKNKIYCEIGMRYMYLAGNEEKGDAKDVKD